MRGEGHSRVVASRVQRCHKLPWPACDKNRQKTQPGARPGCSNNILPSMHAGQPPAPGRQSHAGPLTLMMLRTAPMLAFSRAAAHHPSTMASVTPLRCCCWAAAAGAPAPARQWVMDTLSKHKDGVNANHWLSELAACSAAAAKHVMNRLHAGSPNSANCAGSPAPAASRSSSSSSSPSLSISSSESRPKLSSSWSVDCTLDGRWVMETGQLAELWTLWQLV